MTEQVHSATYQIQRNSLIWLLTAVCASIMPHITRLPLWLTAIVIVSVCCRIMIYRGRWGYPASFVKLLLVVVGIIAIYVDYNTIFGPDAGVALLILTYSLKLVEMHREKDAYVVVLLSYFVIATQFFYSTSLISSIYMIAVLLLITSALIGLNQDRVNNSPRCTAKLAVLLIVQSLPLMILLFIFFPRLPPFWTLEFDSKSAVTGLSDSMSPSDVANLGRSDKLAFRAEFEGDIPMTEKLYWRSIVFTEFDGRSWSANNDNLRSGTDVYWPVISEPAWFSDTAYIGDELKYNIILEPTGKQYLPALDIPFSKDVGVGIGRDFTLRHRKKVTSIFRYQVESSLDYQLETRLPRQARRANTEIPNFGNAQSREFAKALFNKLEGNVDSYIWEVLRFFNSEQFVYTLSPPTATTDIVDHFLFQSREGFCIHYAGAFTYLMRSVGIPARVVAGFQGGEVNPIGQYVLVHQFDAHGWAEVWMEGRGWVRFDPTAHVAPERILEGVQETLAQRSIEHEEPVFSTVRIRQIPFLNNMRLSFDYINFAWNRFVVGYNGARQKAFMERYFNNVTAADLMVVLFVLLTVSVSLLVLILFRFRPTEKVDPVDQAYIAFCKRLEKRGLRREGGETPMAFADRVKQANPELYDPLRVVTEVYCDHQFGLPEAPPLNERRVNRSSRHLFDRRKGGRRRERRKVVKLIRSIRI